jgi:hypothetical protein
MARRHEETTERLSRQRERETVAAKNRKQNPDYEPRMADLLSEMLVRMQRTRWAIGTDHEGLFALFNRGGVNGERAALALAKRKDFVLLPFGNRNARRAAAVLSKRMGERKAFLYMRDTVIPAAIIEASAELLSGDVDYRIGKEHVVGVDGKRAKYSPFDLSEAKLLALLRQRAKVFAERAVLDEAFGPTPSADDQGDGRRATMRLAEALRKNRGALNKLTTRQMALLAATTKSTSDGEIAARLGNTPAAVRKMRSRLLRLVKPKK